MDAFTGGIGTAAQREKYVVIQIDDVHELADVLRQAIKDTNANRVAIDSLSTLYLTKPAFARSIVMTLKRIISGLGSTAFFVSQVSVGERGFGGPGVEHAVDGIIRMDLDEVEGKMCRSIIVWKMRDTKISMVRHPMDIKDDGIYVEWDKYLKIAPNFVKIELLNKEFIDEMKKAMEEARIKAFQQKEIKKEEETLMIKYVSTFKTFG